MNKNNCYVGILRGFSSRRDVRGLPKHHLREKYTRAQIRIARKENPVFDHSSGVNSDSETAKEEDEVSAFVCAASKCLI